MVIDNLNFFDKFGKNLNLDWNSEENIWQGTIFFPEVSTYLYDNENIFVLERVIDDYKFPRLDPGQELILQWKDNEIENELFLYEVEKDYNLNNYFINKKEAITLSYDDLIPISGGESININLPFQFNIAFNPIEEVKYEKTLYIFLKDGSSPDQKTKVAEINFYGEGLDEDERFGVWARNFGIKFNKEDANILKEYDIKEAFPNWKDLNLARKSLLVNKDQVYPYIGTYKGLVNFVNLMGYKDILRVKEYWKNINTKSPYFKKQTLVDITDYLDDSSIDEMNILDKNKNIKFGKQFRKTECLALVYEFTKASDTYDDDGIPIVEETTTFTVDEMFYKLNKLGDKLKNEFIPVNVKIKDIIGEFVYFQKLTIKFWKDDSRIFDFNLNEHTEVQMIPDSNSNLLIRNINILYKKDFENGADFGSETLNSGVSDPYEQNQKYPAAHIQGMIDYIEDFYEEIKNQRYPNLGKRLSWDGSDDPEMNIGAPVVFNIKVDKFTFKNFKGVTFEDVGGAGGFDPHFTLENLDFKNVVEITWRIQKDAPLPYNFEFRAPVESYYRLPHFLPYIGTYRVTAELHDFYGNNSVFSKIIEVQSDIVPQVIATVRLEDKFNYQLENLSNVRLQDFGSSYNYLPKINVLDHDSEIGNIDIDKNIHEWNVFYRNRYGMGQNLYDVEIWNSNTKSYNSYIDSIHPKLDYWGLGQYQIPIKLEDLGEIQLGSFYFMRMNNFVYTDDFKAGFYIRNPRPGQKIQMSLFSEYTIPDFSSLDELVNILNESDHPGISLFNYEIINGRRSDGQYVIHAQAEFLGKETYHILTAEGGGSPTTSSPSKKSSPSNLSDIDKYTFFLPIEVYSDRLIDYFKRISSVFDDETMFLFAKTSDVLSGYVQDPSFWVNNKYWKFNDNKQIGHLPTLYDQNSFNMNDIKVFEKDFNAPQNAIVFFNVNNIDGKNEFVWTLYNHHTNEEIIRVRSVPFFVWKFKDSGIFTLKVDIYDNKGNIYSRQMNKMINILPKKQYIENIERRLNRRKRNLLN